MTPSAIVTNAAGLVERLRLDAPETDREGSFPSSSIDALRDDGLLFAPVSRRHGGSGLGEADGIADLLDVLAHIGRGNLVVGRLFEGHVNALQLIERFGNAEQRARWADDAREGHLFGVWNTEAGDGVKLGTEGAAHRLRGSKTFASGCGHVTRALITAAAADGWQMMVIDTTEHAPREDRSFWKPLGMRATASFKADFTGIEVSSSDLLGAPGDYYRQPGFSGGAIRFAAVQQGGAEAVFDETRRFLVGLGRTDDPYQRMRLGEMAMLIESGRLWLRGAARHASPIEDAPAGQVVAYANLMRSAIESICLRVMQLAERSVGARGLLRPEPFERLHRDLTHYLRQPAPDAALADAGAYVLGHDEPAYRLWT